MLRFETIGRAPDAVPSSVTNYQGRAVMRLFPNPKDAAVSLFTAVDTDLRAAVEATRELSEFDDARVEADLAWQAWEQANTYERRGRITGLLQARYGVTDAQADELFRQAERVTA
ncbi:hypothetical protein Q8W71_17720 [Methylobacterium sp. NEAU 140]|uniref:hypothetical protein n=1 Tax=Methylobacterium sp. NEAU 140 TaxID=3064945 RepID=UPI002736A11B|nr:hypothetical protein [Methylobacterium sp. NEAU 140]MDP4024467.1 hypothetical protein [Methylobacterium sp. NEAU 140]